MGVSLALSRCGGASSNPNPSVATRAMTSAVTPPHGKASPTQSNRPVRATDAMTVSVSSGLIGAQIHHFDFRPFAGHFLGRGQRILQHRAVSHDGQVAPGAGDARFAYGHGFGWQSAAP